MSEPDDLRSILELARSMGQTVRVTKGDVTIELGAPLPKESPPITPEERARAHKRQIAYEEAMLFASSEGFPIDEEST
jgi:hypothetical protein